LVFSGQRPELKHEGANFGKACVYRSKCMTDDDSGGTKKFLEKLKELDEALLQG